MEFYGRTFGSGQYFYKEGEWLSEIVPFIGEVGFPIVVTLILLYRIEAKLDQVIQAIDQLPDRMRKVS